MKLLFCSLVISLSTTQFPCHPGRRPALATLPPRSSQLQSFAAKYQMSTSPLTTMVPDTAEGFSRDTQGLCPPQTHGLSSMLYPTAQASKTFGILREEATDILAFCMTESGFLVACPALSIADDIKAADTAVAHLMEHISSATEIKPTTIYSHPTITEAFRRRSISYGFQAEPYLSNIQLEAPETERLDLLMKGYTFRIATEADLSPLESCLTAFNEELGLKTPMNMAANLIQQQAAFLLIEDASKDVVSICCAAGDCMIPPSIRMSRITCLFTPQDRRGNGLARYLLDETLAHLRQAREGSLIRLYVNALFPPIRKFYREADFLEQDGGQIYECIKLHYTTQATDAS